ncbi:ABC transporter ATP-binding protein [Marinibaculum pumilum]|uniref:ABC transporter ATP-binding protein n=1 Tax=Marinibaculum pumilum TaxID=1766165 RepID=A0ABV7KVR1_9PROT
MSGRATAADTAIQVIGCGKTFGGGTVALEPTDLSIAAGETVVLLGPSGCGKTTMLRIIAGLESPDPGGRVLFGGEDVTPLPIERRNIGMVFQSYALFPNMSVAENVAYGLRVRGVGRARRRAEAAEALALCRIADLAERRIDQLSGGQRQRVALARALAARPRALLLDEPLTALDASLREHLRGEIDALLRRLGITAVYVTHDQAEAMTIADRVVVMRKGGIAQSGSPQEVYFRPADRFVAEFVGLMNRIDGRLRDGAFDGPAGRLPLPAPDRPDAALFFRPEAARILAPGATCPAGMAVLQFTIARVQFLGDRQRLILEAGGPQDAAPAAGARPVVQVDADNRGTFAPGQPLMLAVATDDLLMF